MRTMTVHDLPLFPEFTPLGPDHRDLFEAHFRAHPPTISEFNFTELFIWRNHRQIRVGNLRGNVCVVVEKWGEEIAYAPFGEADLERSVLDIVDWQRGREREPRVFGISDRLAEALTASHPELLVAEDRDAADYVYSIRDLIDLPGKKYHAKKNLVNMFKEYPFEFLPLSKDLVPHCLAFQEEWCTARFCSIHGSLREEDEAVREALENLERLRVIGGVIRVKGTVEAFTVGGELNPETAVVHVEKANPGLKGIYQAVNQLFCEKMLSGYAYVNREQDLGDPGLRQAKLSYHPHHLVGKKILKQQSRSVAVEGSI